MRRRIYAALVCLCVILAFVSLPASADMEKAQPAEQFSLKDGITYYFDISNQNFYGKTNPALPDTSLHYVPFTYVGTVNAYKLATTTQTTTEYANENEYAHSLFIANYNVKYEVSWSRLNSRKYIFGKTYTSNGISYRMRAPSVGSSKTGSGDSKRGSPANNEWDQILNKYGGYIKNFENILSWGQDSSASEKDRRAARGKDSSARGWSTRRSGINMSFDGYRPVLEVLNADELGKDALKVVTLNLGHFYAIVDSEFVNEQIRIVVKNGESFTAPSADGLRMSKCCDKDGFRWKDDDGNIYAPGDSVPANVKKLTAQYKYIEQFSLNPGDMYYFDLSELPKTVTSSKYGSVLVTNYMPDKTLHYAPFIYAGTISAYKLSSEMVTTEEFAQQNEYSHSLFVSYGDIFSGVSWCELNDAGLIFGKNYLNNGINYSIRAMSMGSGAMNKHSENDIYTENFAWYGFPINNEWDTIADKNPDYLKLTNSYSWGQDVCAMPEDFWLTTPIVARGYRFARENTIRRWLWRDGTLSHSQQIAYLPVLEVMGIDALGTDGLKEVVLDLNGGKLGESSANIKTIVKNGEEFTAPPSEGLNRPDGNNDSYFMWLGSDGVLYAPGDKVASDVNRLTAQWTDGELSFSVTYKPDSNTIETDAQTDTKIFDVELTLKDGIFTREGYTQLGWTTVEGGTTEYELGGIYSDNSSIVLYPAWENPAPVHNHTYGDWSSDSTEHWHECTDENCPDRLGSITDRAAHIYDNDEDATCNECGYVRGVNPPDPSHVHTYGDWSSDSTEHWHECTDENCPDKLGSITDRAAHVYDNDEDTTCNECGYVRGVNPPDPSHVHTYGDWSSDSTEHWHECTDENCPDRLGSITDRASHIYDNEKDNVCDECGYVRSFIPSVPVFLPAHHVHTYGDWSKNSTEHWHECTNMNCPNRADSIKDRAEHDFGEWVVTLQPTAESEGREERVCAVCAYKEKHSIPVVEPEEIDEPELFTLSFEMNGGSGIPDISLTRGESVDLSEYEPTRRGYDFDGWYSDKKLTKKITSVKLNRDRTVYAGWTEQISDVDGEIDIDFGGHFSDESENPNTGCGLDMQAFVFCTALAGGLAAAGRLRRQREKNKER